MGLCVTKDLFADTPKEQPTAAPLQPDPLPAAPSESHQASGGSSGVVSHPASSPSSSSSHSGGGGYNVAALATSSLVGLIQSVKDHVTKPTAMARGRVAHLIEWKVWSAPQDGREPPATEEELYADLTDELKEARFAAGVAEQFAVTEATLSAWSSLDEEELRYWGAWMQDAVPLQDMENIYLQENLLFSPQAPGNLAESLWAFPPSSRESPGPNVPSMQTLWSDSSGLGQGAAMGPEGGLGPLWLQQSTPSLRYVDSSSLSEDDVFYN